METDVKFISIHLAHGDGGERGTGPVIAYCSTRSQAVEAAKGRGWYGGNGHVAESSAVRIGDKVYLLANSGRPVDLDSAQAKRDAELRQQTLDALTPEQKRVLGIKEPTP